MCNWGICNHLLSLDWASMSTHSKVRKNQFSILIFIFGTYMSVLASNTNPEELTGVAKAFTRTSYIRHLADLILLLLSILLSLSCFIIYYININIRILFYVLPSSTDTPKTCSIIM